MNKNKQSFLFFFLFIKPITFTGDRVKAKKIQAQPEYKTIIT